MAHTFSGLPTLVAQEETTEEVGHEPAHAEEHNPVLPEPDELIYGGLAFLLVFVALAKFAFPKLNEGLKARSDKIQGDLEKAESSRTDAERLLADYQAKLEEARGESNRIIEEARKSAEAVRKDLLAKAEDESRQLVSRAQEEIRAERDRAFAELRGAIGDLSIQVAERVVGESLTKDRHAKLVDDYIDELSKKKG